jgi:hypothetical protein
MSLVIAVGAFVVLLLLVTGLLLAGLMRRNREPVPDVVWLQNFSPARYRPMLRLLADDDYEFLTAMGSDPSVVRRLRGERRRIFRLYLKNLIRDFSRLHRAARILVLESEVERSDVAARLVRIRFDFFLAVFAVRCRLVLHAAGIGTVDVRGLITALECIRADFRTLAPAAQPSAV